MTNKQTTEFESQLKKFSTAEFKIKTLGVKLGKYLDLYSKDPKTLKIADLFNIEDKSKFKIPAAKFNTCVKTLCECINPAYLKQGTGKPHTFSKTKSTIGEKFKQIERMTVYLKEAADNIDSAIDLIEMEEHNSETQATLEKMFNMKHCSGFNFSNMHKALLKYRQSFNNTLPAVTIKTDSTDDLMYQINFMLENGK